MAKQMKMNATHALFSLYNYFSVFDCSDYITYI